MRRIIKPFTVELRSGKRKTSTPLSLPSEQPAVDWPEALLAEFRADPELPKPSGRVLPALDEAPEPLPPRSGEGEADAAEAAAEPRWAASVTEPAPAASIVFEDETPVPAALPLEAAVVVAASDSAPIRGARLSREAFARGERWKARLPAAVHRTRLGFRTKRGGSV
ncbi:hypothetical protein P7D22_17085 [Lichenihabitans sp. Uapishka_5]|uniref:hypothetical protein n=1 Tax=Lichenihabitans sp. Uapishka_5 TaxID=3037302 RepID=UPI0029E7ED9D|nr:hypothetical protein [Lichenihabitans sp. Uapishka_5]MDX7952883.1 hypothetical protein [Lichenihabitans sp. Uapishka_5]